MCGEHLSAPTDMRAAAIPPYWAGSTSMRNMIHAPARWFALSLLLVGADAGCVITPDANGHVDYPAGETSVGNYAFQGCTALRSITLPSSLTSIGFGAFERSSLTSITLPSSITSIPPGFCRYCTSLTSITLPSSVTQVIQDAFRGCTSLTSVTLPSSLTRVEANVFRGCTSLSSIVLPASLTFIGDMCFNGCSSLTLVQVPPSCTVGALAFYNTAAAAPGYVFGLPPAPPALPPASPAAPPPALLTCGPGTSANIATSRCEITCGTGRRTQELEDQPASDARPPADAREIARAYVEAHPELAVWMDDERMRHLERLVEHTHFGRPALP